MTRSFTRAVSVCLLAGLAVMLPAPRSVAQGVALVARAPRFLMAGSSSSAEPVEVEASRIASLRRKVSLDLDNVRLEEALHAVARQAGIRLVYVRSVLPLDSLVRFRSDSITVAAALTELLLGLPVDVLVSGGSQIALVRSTAQRMAPGSVVGRVTDSTTGAPLVGASVYLEGTRWRTATAEDGGFRLPEVLPGSYTLVARRIGYAASQRAVTLADGETVELMITLAPQATMLDEIVATATGRQERYKTGNAISRIDAESLTVSAPIRGLTDLITARAAGVQVLGANGISGQAPRIRVRGLNSFSVTNDPLVVIDGVRVENSPGSNVFNVFTQTSPFLSGRLSDLNPDEIESIDIVKGPSAATLYGTDAANGVIVITTRKGRAGPPAYRVYAEEGVLEPDPASPFPANWYAFGRNTTTGAPQQCLLSQRAAGACVQDSVKSFNPMYQSVSAPLGTGYRGVYGAQVSGGVSQFTYFVSGEYEHETGYLRMSDMDQQFLAQLRGAPPLPEQIRPNAVSKISLRGNVGTTLGSRADIALSTGLILNDVRLPNIQTHIGASRGRGFRGTDDAGIAAEWLGRRPANVFAQVNQEAVVRYTGGIAGNYRPFSWLATRGTLGVDFSSNNQSTLSRRADRVLFNETGARVDANTRIALYTLDASATATFPLTSALSSRSSVGVQYNRRKLHTTVAQAVGLPVGGETVTGAAQLGGGESTAETIVAGAFAEQTWGLHDRLFLTGAVRLDGGSTFGANFRTVVYPKASVSWLAIASSTEGRMGLASLRLRGAFGSSGVQPGVVAALARDTLFTGFVNGTQSNAAAINALGNPDLKPERQTEFETGMDAEWLEGRLRLEATFYNRKSANALINRPFAPSLGILFPNNQQINIGAVRNRGIEVLVHARAFERRGLSLDVTLNGSANQNRLLRLGEGIQPIGFVLRQVPGYPLNGIWDRPILGYSDANGNGILEPNEVTVGNSLAYLGSSMPIQQLGIGLTLGMLDNRLRLTATGDYRGDLKRLDGAGANRCGFFNNCRAVNDPTASLADQAAAIAIRGAASRAGYVFDGSFFRLREVGLTYFAPERWARMIGARTLALSVTARNLLLITGFPGLDPESEDAVNSDTPFGNFSEPPARYFILRVSAGL